MDIVDRGYRFHTIHNPDGNIAHVEGHYARFQEQAPIRSRQDYELDFYGKGGTIVLGVTALPRRAAPATMAALRRATPNARRSRATDLTNNTLDTNPSSPRLATAPLSASPTSVPSIMALNVRPGFRNPFDNDWFDSGLDPLPFPPIDPTDGGGGGGGGGGLYHAAVRIRLFVFGTDQPVATWDLPAGIDDRERKVKYEPEGFPSEDAPVRRTTWWRVVVTPLGPDPVEIYIAAHVRIADVPIRTTPLSVRLVSHLFRVALEALVPQAEVSWNKVSVSIGRDIADLLGIPPRVLEKSISPVNSNAKLQSLNITTISGQELHTIAMKHYRERAGRYQLPSNVNSNLSLDQKVALLFKSQLTSLSEVQPDDVCVRIEAAFTDASLSVWGFDVASLRGELGEIFLAFDHGLNRLRPFAFLDVDFSTLAALALDFLNIFTEVPKDVNKVIEDHLGEYETAQSILKYMKAFLARAVGQSSTVYSLHHQNNAWQIRHSDDPVIPPPRGGTQPPVGGPTDGGLINLLARHNSALGIDVTAPRRPIEANGAIGATDESTDTFIPALEGREFPPGFFTEGEHVNRLDRHQSIVVVMMENRSYDHLLGDLANARPSTVPYDGVPGNVKNASSGGFLTAVPIVHTRDLRLGTAISVSPRHDFEAVQFQIGDGTNQGRSSGDMQGFARDVYHRTDSPQLACTVYGESELPIFYDLADKFLVCDRWFAAHPGPTTPNRFATVMGRIPELDNFANDDPRIGYLKDRSLFDVLSGARIDWRVFESDLSQVRMFDRYRLNDRNVVPLNDKLDGLEATLRKSGPLPRVMFIEPNFTSIPPLKTADDDHPPADLAHGQAFISRVCDLLWDTNRFDEVLLVITYDEHGGFYDHVPPPGTPKGEPGSYPPLIEGGPTWLGVRVPTFVVSPYVSAHAKSRTIFDHTSILKTILIHNRENLSNDVLLSFGDRVNQANDLSMVLDLDTPRQAPVPFVRRVPDRDDGNRIFGDIVDLDTVLTATQPVPEVNSNGVPGETPRQVIITERTEPPRDGVTEPRDFHAAIERMFKPRRMP